ncbi:HesA/MoeB/ThiF family protein [Alteromonas sp. KUL49]|uniref:HesA/MoeB/ThiF family protein n=1 Tax=Alteromonas sp. KUL49 TaxID=2480798 RepID=UPI00102EFDFC|nr:HesA/MoeB/ThiF family protein [Alteromonas sp. KUL49]TAP40649.1 HesA/MoeB/ThiF family protein [Alteromonas sp. KUL49]GEA10811.1 hypothetical protein KUL49_11860 [Alteromonas sp. KUL49]
MTPSDIKNRYIRQTCLPLVGDKGQAALTQAHVVVIGAGGLGCAVLPYLAASGIGKVTIVDPDTVSISNLHRQVLFTESDIDKPKVECVSAILKKQNTTCQVSTNYNALTPENVDEICLAADIVMDCADNFAVTYILSDYCAAHNIPLVSASVLGFEGYVGAFCANAPSVRAVFPDLPQRAQNCSTAGVLGPVVGVLGTLQCQMALNILLNISPSPLGQMVSVNLQTFNQQSFRFDSAPEPDDASKLSFIGNSSILNSDWVVDLRTSLYDDVSAEGKAPELKITSLAEFKANAPSPHSEQRAVIVCRTGLTAWQAARHLQTYWQGKIVLVALGESKL